MENFKGAKMESMIELFIIIGIGIYALISSFQIFRAINKKKKCLNKIEPNKSDN